MKILITGVAGFIGFSLANRLLNNNISVTGIDDLNKYYSKKLKLKRISILKKSKLFKFYKIDINKKKKVDKFFKKNFTHIFNFAAQPGVRETKNFPENYFYSKSDIDSVEFSKNQNQIEEFIESTLSSVISDQNINLIVHLKLIERVNNSYEY